MSRRYWVLAIAGVALAAGAWLLRPKPRAEGASHYVSPKLCASCHQEIAKTYRLTGMARSFYRPENTVEDYQSRNSFYHRPSDRHYTMLARDGKYFQRRHQIGYNGAITNIVEESIDYVIGSGNHARSYLHRTAEGKLAELPVTWFAEKNGYWAMSPGYDRADHSDFRRTISYECMSCHNGYPSSLPAGSDSIFAADLPEGIDCQRCHGPGRAHVEAASSGKGTPDSILRAIVNPARLSRERQLDVCEQCHLQTTSLRSPDSIRRYNRAPFSYKPGDPLGDYEVFFDFQGPATFEIDHAAYRLSKSKCFIKSQMTCTTCHDPHRVSEGPAHFEKICLSCHSAAHATPMAAVKTCLDCHMPKRRTDDVVHVVMTDHFIQKKLPAGDLLAERQEIHEPPPANVVAYRPVAGDELYRGVAESEQHPPVLANLSSAIEKFHPPQPEFYFALGRASVKAGAPDQGIQLLQHALKIRSDFRPALKELGAALSNSGDLSRAAQLLEQATAAPSRDAGALADLGGVYLAQGRLDQAEQALRRAIALNPDLSTAHNLLGLEQSRKGDQAAAQASFREAIRLQPDLAPAQNNLGNLLAGGGDLRQAIFHFKKAIAADPDIVDAHYNLGQALAASGSLPDALIELQTTVRLNPKFVKAECDLGRLLEIAGRAPEAPQHYRKAIEIDPNFPESHFYLGQSLAVQKKMADAENQFRLAIQASPGFYAAHFELACILLSRREIEEAKAHLERAGQSPDPEMRSQAQNALRKVR